MLKENFLEGIKKIIDSDEVVISIESCDETDYLMRSPNNLALLMKSIKNVENGVNLIEVPYEEIERKLKYFG